MDFFIKFNFILQLSVNKMVYNVNVKFIRRDILKNILILLMVVLMSTLFIVCGDKEKSNNQYIS